MREEVFYNTIQYNTGNMVSGSFIALLTVFVSCWSLGWAQSSISITYYQPGTNCTVAANERVGFMSTTTCLMESSAQYCQNKASQCGMMVACDSNKVTFEYWYSSGQQCTRSAPQYTISFPTNTCLSASEGYPYKGYEEIIGCNP